MRKQLKPGLKIGITIGIVVVIFFFLFPLYWLVITSLKTTKLVFSVPPAIFFRPTFQSFYNLFVNKEVYRYMLNSLIIASFSTLVGLFLGTMAAYTLSQIKSGFGKISLIGLLIIRMLPLIIFLVPLYVIYSKLHLLDTYRGMILGYQVFLVPFATWVIWSFFKNLPTELVDASRIDGCSPVKTLLHIFLPLSIPALGVVFIFCFIFCWNEFMFALVITGRATRTTPVVAATFIGERGIDWTMIAAISTVLILPTVTLMFFVAGHLVRGLTAGALKG